MAFIGGIIFPSQARTAAPTDAVIYIPDGVTTLMFHILMTAVSGAPAITLILDEPDGKGGWQNSVLATSVLSTVTDARLVIGDVAPTGAGFHTTVLPQALRVRVTHGTADNVTYAVEYRGR